MTKPTLQARLIRALNHYGCRPATLARVAGVSQSVVHKVKTGEQTALHSDNYERLEPYLTLAVPKDALEGKGRAPRQDTANFQMP